MPIPPENLNHSKNRYESFYKGLISKFNSNLSVSSTDSSHDEVHVIMGAVELGYIPGLKTVTGAPINIFAGGVGVVLNEISSYYPEFLRAQNGKLTIIGMLMDKMSKDNMVMFGKMEIVVAEKTETIDIYTYESPNGAHWIFLDHPRFKRFSATTTGYLYNNIMQSNGVDGINDQVDEQLLWSTLNQSIAQVFQRLNGDIYIPHDYHTSPATFYIYHHQGLVPISAKPLVHNDGYRGYYSFDPHQRDYIRKIWNLSPSEMDNYFSQGDQLIMLDASIKTAEEHELYTGFSVSYGTAREINQRGPWTGWSDFHGRMGALQNSLSDEHRPYLSKTLTPGTEKELLEDGISHPKVIDVFSSAGFAYGWPSDNLDVTISMKARAKEAVQLNFGMDIDPSRPLFVSFARMTYQKGLGFIADNVHYILSNRGQVIVGGPVHDGVGENERDTFLDMKKKLEASCDPNAHNFIFLNKTVNGKLKGLLLAGSDFFLIPSRYEPCGLTDVEALYHGSIPIARSTGGLSKGKQTLLYIAPNADDQKDKLREALSTAFEIYHDHEKFINRQFAAMKEDFSVKRHFEAFEKNMRIEVYGKLIKVLSGLVMIGHMPLENAIQELENTVLHDDYETLLDMLETLPPCRRSTLTNQMLSKRYEYLRLVTSSCEYNVSTDCSKPQESVVLSKKLFQPAQGWRVTQRDCAGRAVRGHFRFLSNNRNTEGEDSALRFYLACDYNHWCHQISDEEFEKSRLRPCVEDPAYLESDEIDVYHGMEYLIFRRQRSLKDGSVCWESSLLSDPANVAYSTPGLLEKIGRPVHNYKNSMFWDVDGPDHFQLRYPRPDWRTISGGGIMVETDLFGLVAKWQAPGGQIGPVREIEAYNFIADSGIVAFLSDHGIRRIKFLPLGEHVEAEHWRWLYQTYPFAIDCQKGTPAEFARMVDVFNLHKIAVIFDEVLGHFPVTGSREMTHNTGMHLHTKEDGSLVYGHNYLTEWETIPYDDTNPYVVRYKIDAILSHVVYFGVSGVRMDNAAGGDRTGIYFRAGGPQFLQQMNRELHSYDPSIYTLCEAFTELKLLTHSSETSNGTGFNASIHWQLQKWIEHNLPRSSSDIEMYALQDAIAQPFLDHEFPRVTYLTNHDMADNGRVLPAQEVINSHNEDQENVLKKTIVFGSLAMLIGSDCQTMLQADLGQTGYFGDTVVDWELLNNTENAKVFKYWSHLNNYFTKSPVFSVRHDLKSPINHLDETNKVLSLWRTDMSSHYVLVVINFGKTMADVGGISNYNIGVAKRSHYKVVLDSEDILGEGLPPVFIQSQPKPLHSHPFSVSLPLLAPLHVLILENSD